MCKMLKCIWFCVMCLIPLAIMSLETLQQINSLNKNGTYIANETELIRKLNEIMSQGLDSFQIVTDFDNTLTVDSGITDKPVLNSFEMFRKCPSVPQSYKDEEYKLFQKYSPIENDPNKSKEEISEHLVEWYTLANNLTKGLKFPRQELMEIARTQRSYFREGLCDLISWADDRKVPILVLSSGLGDAVASTLEAANYSSVNLKIISNFLELDHEDIIIGMKGKPIHSLNKNEASIKNALFYDNIKQRRNVLLMGDTIGDSNMVDGIDNLGTVIKIGFLSNGRIERLTEYLKNFDIVLQNDQTMDVVNDIVRHF